MLRELIEEKELQKTPTPALTKTKTLTSKSGSLNKSNPNAVAKREGKIEPFNPSKKKEELIPLDQYVMKSFE